MLAAAERKHIRQKMLENKHEVYVVSVEEMDAIIRSSPKGNRPGIQKRWQKVKGKLETGATYSSAIDDAVTLSRLVGDLGSFGAKVYIKRYGGKPHIILKGHPGLRKILTGTKYGIKNPKIVSMGLGKVGATTAARQGGILTVVLLTTYRVIDYFLTDEGTLSGLIGKLATDVVKVGIATGAAILAATSVAAVSTVAILPLLAVIIVGSGVTLLLEIVDNHYNITERVISALDEIGDDPKEYMEKRKQQIKDSTNEALGSLIEHAVDSAKAIAVKWVTKQIKQYLSPLPRVQ